jgi:hypothetical protein
MSELAANLPDPDLAAHVEAVVAEAAAEGEPFELKVELAGTYETLGAHGRALASLLLALHGWLDDQEAESVEVAIDGRRFTLHAQER